MKKIYLDVCCYNRPFDDLTQDKIKLEAEAVKLILKRVFEGKLLLIGSDIAELEISRIRDLDRREKVHLLYSLVYESVKIDNDVIDRTREIEVLGIKPVDALHISCAEKGAAEIFFTTDDGLTRNYDRHGDAFQVEIVNPLSWFTGVV